jgi:hypothetical protein
MRWQRLVLVLFMAVAVIAGAWVLAGAADPGQTVRVDAPPTFPATAAPPTTLSADEQRRMIDNLTGQRLCDAPPVELTDEMAHTIERTLSTLPLPPTVPSDTPGGVINVHRPLVPC